ncbi:hypothetical protein ACTXT7_017518 [Hymenolepis weldensis]
MNLAPICVHPVNGMSNHISKVWQFLPEQKYFFEIAMPGQLSRSIWADFPLSAEDVIVVKSRLKRTDEVLKGGVR